MKHLKTHIHQINKDQTQRTNIKNSKEKTTNNTQGDSDKDNLRDLWDKIKGPNVQIIGVLEEDKKKGHEKILEEIIVGNFSKMGKEIDTQIQ